MIVRIFDSREELYRVSEGRYAFKLTDHIDLHVLDLGSCWQAELHHADFCGPLLTNGENSTDAQAAVDALCALYLEIEEAMS